MAIPEIKELVPEQCGLWQYPLFDGYKPWNWPGAWLANAAHVKGIPLRKVAAEQGYDAVRFVVGKLWRMLPAIHTNFGFFGGFRCRDIYFDKKTQKVTLCRWNR